MIRDLSFNTTECIVTQWCREDTVNVVSGNTNKSLTMRLLLKQEGGKLFVASAEVQMPALKSLNILVDVIGLPVVHASHLSSVQVEC